MIVLSIVMLTDPDYPIRTINGGSISDNLEYTNHSYWLQIVQRATLPTCIKTADEWNHRGKGIASGYLSPNEGYHEHWSVGWTILLVINIILTGFAKFDHPHLQKSSDTMSSVKLGQVCQRNQLFANN